MKKYLILMIIMTATGGGVAEARAHRVTVSPECNVTMPCDLTSTDTHARRVGRLPPAARETRLVAHRHFRVAKRHKRASEAVRVALVAAPAHVGGLVAPLAAKVAQIQAACGSRVISGVRHTRIAGTRHMSLHASGQAADLQGNPSCIYASLGGWAGGYSVDYGRMQHVHVSWGGPEAGLRFRHGGGGHRRHYAHRHHRHYARSYARMM